MVNNYVEVNRAVLSHTHLSQLECDVGKVFAFKVEHDDPLVQALPQVDKRVEVEGGDVGASPPLRPGLSPLLVLDPAALLHPLLRLVVQLVHQCWVFTPNENWETFLLTTKLPNMT